MRSIRVGFLGYDGMTALDLVGPMDAFAQASSPSIGVSYELVVLGLSQKPFVASSGLTVRPHESLQTAGPLDTLVIAGGAGSRRLEHGRILVPWLVSHASEIRRIATVCTGLYFLAATGLIDGAEVTTHWYHTADVARRFPKLNVNADAIYLKHGKYYTSAGISAGIDLALALIEEDYGEETALRAAREMVVYLKRPGGQRQYSEPLRMQVDASDAFSGLVTWMTSNLNSDLSVEALARRVNMSRRHFTRVFRASFGSSPSALVEELRLDQARTLLSAEHATVQSVASAVGFSSADSFRRAFVRRFGLSPTAYRVPFSG